MDDSPWDDDDPTNTGLRDTEWSKISTEFTTTGYREGISAGKEVALQEGFDSGFADVGVPVGREVGVARGMTAAVLSMLMQMMSGSDGDSDSGRMEMEVEVREIQKRLNDVRLSDVAPRDLEAEAHAREHEHELELGGEKREMEILEDMFNGLGETPRTAATRRPTLASVREDSKRVRAMIINSGG